MKEEKRLKDLAKVFAIYDNQLKEVKELILFPTTEKANSMLVELASSVNSPYYQTSKSYDVYILGDIDTETMDYKENRSYFGSLNSFVDEERVKYQRVIQVLNYIPNGYFKMPKEMQEEVKNDIDNAVKTYVENYVDFSKLSVKSEVIDE